jgi:dihydrofolate reductase
MQAPGGPQEDTSGGFAHGGWLVPFADEDMGRIVDRQFATADAFLLGRGTYEIFASFWPSVTDPADGVATALNTLPKYVVSTSLTSPSWAGTTIVGDDVVARIRQLKDAPGRDLQVHGSAGLTQTLIRHRLVDEFRLWVFPVVLGTGKRLFADGTVPTGLECVATESTSTGVAVHTYRPTGEPRHGEFSLEDSAEKTTLLS